MEITSKNKTQYTFNSMEEIDSCYLLENGIGLPSSLLNDPYMPEYRRLFNRNKGREKTYEYFLNYVEECDYDSLATVKRYIDFVESVDKKLNGMLDIKGLKRNAETNRLEDFVDKRIRNAKYHIEDKKSYLTIDLRNGGYQAFKEELGGKSWIDIASEITDVEFFIENKNIRNTFINRRVFPWCSFYMSITVSKALDLEGTVLDDIMANEKIKGPYLHIDSLMFDISNDVDFIKERLPRLDELMKKGKDILDLDLHYNLCHYSSIEANLLNVYGGGSKQTFPYIIDLISDYKGMFDSSSPYFPIVEKLIHEEDITDEDVRFSSELAKSLL